MRFHGLPYFRQTYFEEVGLTQISGDHDFFKYFFNRKKIHDKFQDTQTPPSSSLKFVEFETYYIEPNLSFFSANKICNGPATWSILTLHYAWGSMTT